MSHVQHRALCVTSWDTAAINGLMKELKSVDIDTTPYFDSACNDYVTFFIVPCGSKARWPEEDRHLSNIDKAISIIKKADYPEDGSNSIEYHVAIYGENEG